VSSGKTHRHRLDRGGNRQINATIHRIAVTRLRCHPETQGYIARKRAEGKSTKEAIRCLKRHLARRIWHLLQSPRPDKEHRHHHQSLDMGAAKGAATVAARLSTSTRRERNRGSDGQDRRRREPWDAGGTGSATADQATQARSMVAIRVG
jgi:transposase